MTNEEFSKILNKKNLREITEKFGTPVFVYSQEILEQQVEKALDFPNAYGLTVRYAMKANSNINILRIFDYKGIHIDASSAYEVERAALAGISSEKILLTSQQLPENLGFHIGKGVNFNACSLNQLESYGKIAPNSKVSVRINPGLGSGGIKKTNTGGPSSSFGIWYEQIDEVLRIADKYNLQIGKIHTHIGSGSDSEVWKKVAGMSLDNVEKFIEAGHNIKTLNLGGGYKVGRMTYENSTDLQECGEPVKQAFIDFAEKTGKKLKLEIEPGTFLVANAGDLISEVIDIKSTPDYNFIITNSGMNEITRPSLYGAQHPITVIPMNRDEKQVEHYIVSGHCCESGDILTPRDGNPEALKSRKLLRAEIGDLVVIGGAGAYCSSMSTKNYNSYPEAAEVLLDRERKPSLIRKRQTLEQVTQNEKIARHLRKF